MRRRQALAALAGAPWVAAAAPWRAAPAVREDVLARLRALAPNQSAMLGRAAVLGEFNDTARRFGLHRTGPRARDFCRRMAWAPERRRALYTGANHGAPHRLNDVWEFDLPSLSWLLLYAPDRPRSYAGLGDDASDVVYVDGVLRTERGGPAVIGHTWSGLTWDPDRHCLLFMNTWPIDVAPLIARKGGDAATRDRSPPLWAFDPASRRWAKWRAEPPWPKAAVGALLEHVPELGGSLWHLNNWQLSASWLLRDGRWSVVVDERSDPSFSSQAPGRDLIGYHDPVRRLIVAQCRRRTFHFDTGRRRWSAFDLPDAPDGHTANAAFLQAPGGGGLLVDHRSGALHAYSHQPQGWRAVQPDGPAMPHGQRVLAYADAALGVLVVIDDDTVWAYRPPAGPGRG